MKKVRSLGLVMVVFALLTFTFSIFLGGFHLTAKQFNAYADSKGISSELFRKEIQQNLLDKDFHSTWAFSKVLIGSLDKANDEHKSAEEWDKVIWDNPKELAFNLEKLAANGEVSENKGLFLFLTFGLAILGGLMFILPAIKIDGPPGIKNDGVFKSPATNRGWIAGFVFIWLVSFYLSLYFYPNLIVNWTLIVDPVKAMYAEGGASQWFLYGLLYCSVMLVMGVRMLVKYRHNKYQILRTISVIFFQIVFAFVLVELLPLLNMPSVDFKNAWPLDYDFLYDWNVKDLLRNESYGKMGVLIFVWGIVLSLIIVPVFVYFFGKRWYCSWVCGCGGLAETLGDPYRQLSNKTLLSWRVERWVIHGVLVFAVIMTAWVGLHSYAELHAPDGQSGQVVFLGISAYDIRSWYGLLIGSFFSGVLGTGFYPIFGNRVWCRFGCPLAAYMGLVQRFKSRFRITTNGGQCISCGNCSTYCEQGIDVRWYAQRGQNIVRSSCVGCGVCSAVCPRGVLKLENGPEEGRLQENPILIGNEGIRLKSEL